MTEKRWPLPGAKAGLGAHKTGAPPIVVGSVVRDEAGNVTVYAPAAKVGVGAPPPGGEE